MTRKLAASPVGLCFHVFGTAVRYALPATTRPRGGCEMACREGSPRALLVVYAHSGLPGSPSGTPTPSTRGAGLDALLTDAARPRTAPTLPPPPAAAGRARVSGCCVLPGRPRRRRPSLKATWMGVGGCSDVPLRVIQPNTRDVPHAIMTTEPDYTLSLRRARPSALWPSRRTDLSTAPISGGNRGSSCRKPPTKVACIYSGV